MHEKRLTKRLMTMWEQLQGGEEGLPSSHKLNKSSFSDIWPQCIIFRVEATANPGNAALVAEDIGERVGTSLFTHGVGKTVTMKSLDPMLKKLLKDVPQVIEEAEPVQNSGTLVNPVSAKTIKYRICLLPFAGKQAGVDKIMVGFSWIEC